MRDRVTVEDLFINTLMNDVLTKLDGTHPDMMSLAYDDKPSKIILLGTLASPDPGRVQRTSAADNSISVSFLVPELDVVNIKVSAHLAVFYRAIPSLEEQKVKFGNRSPDGEFESIRLVWKRRDIDLGPYDIAAKPQGTALPLDLSSLTEQVRNDPDTLPRVARIPRDALDSEGSYRAYFAKVRGAKPRVPKSAWKARLEAISDGFVQDGSKLRLVKVSLINETAKDNFYETFLFDARLIVDLGGVNIVPFTYRFEYEGFPRVHTSPVRSVNCHAEFDLKSGVIVTYHWALSQQHRLNPRTALEGEDGYTLRFKESDVVPVIRKLVDALDRHAVRLSELKDQDEKFRFDRDRFVKNAERIRQGLALLESGDARVAKAFSLMQETFDKASPYPGWRLFQLAFILALLPDIVDKSRGRNVTELLHVYTGGGKSEAYFGAVVFAMFYDRLTGKDRGLTAITKFPLRMLSVQQLQRIARIVIWAEEIRKQHSVPGAAFSVGYFVGSSDEFPRKCGQLVKSIAGKGPLPGKIVQECPICGGTVQVVRDEARESTAHRCFGCERLFFLYYTDEEVYRLLPTFVVCTVDKLAGVATNRRFRSLFGGALSECPSGHGYFPTGDSCEATVNGVVCRQTGRDLPRMPTGPTLMVQDEMHLVREGFGGINAHFETFLAALQGELASYEPKHVAMTATVAGAEEQVRQLYVEDLSVFPGDSPGGPGKDDFFFELVARDGEPEIQRRIVGLRPNNRDNQFASLLTIRYVADFIARCETSLSAFSSKLGVEEHVMREVLAFYKTLLTYHNKKADVHSIGFFLEAVVNSQLEGAQVEPLALTGDNTLDEIREAIGKVETFGTRPEDAQKMLAVFATSVVSHGVDLDRLNIMIFQGIPKSTSEYLQALSRAGRSHKGVVFVWFYPNRVRDISFYESFVEYHDLLYQMVEKVPLSRWTELVFKETFTSLFCGAILNYFSGLLGEPLYTVAKVNRVFSDPSNRDRLRRFLDRVFCVSAIAVGSDYFKERIPVEIEERLNYLRGYTGRNENFFPNALREYSDRYYRTQFGMRGIQETVPLSTMQEEAIFEKRYRG